MTFEEMVREFHEAFNGHVGTYPKLPSIAEVFLRRGLVCEEFDELIDALEDCFLDEIAKEAADLIYVVVGLCVSFGIPITKVFEEVHRSNMAKVGGTYRADGKLLKPEGWTPPDIKGLLECARQTVLPFGDSTDS